MDRTNNTTFNVEQQNASNALENTQLAKIDIKKSGITFREKYRGALLFNFLALLLPSLYATLPKLWVAHIDSSLVVTTDTYTYIGTVAGTLNDGLPKAVWLVIGDKSNRSTVERFSLTYTVILIQTILGLIMSIAFLGGANTFAGTFVPAEVREASLKYVRITSFSALAFSIETAVSNATRALDKPDVPLLISCIKVTCNIVLDMLLISWFHVGSHKPTINDQASIRVACDLTAALAGLLYFSLANRFSPEQRKKTRPSFRALKAFARPSFIMFMEGAVRNGIGLWLVSIVVAMGSDYATAWGIFTTIRYGLVNVPVKALSTTTLAFAGHHWGEWRKRKWQELVDEEITTLNATWKDIQGIVEPALYAVPVAIAIEIPLCIFLSRFGGYRFAFWISGSTPVAEITAHMLQTIGWCYIFTAVSSQLFPVLQAAAPIWFLCQSLAVVLLWVLLWAIACQIQKFDGINPWTYQSFITGGSWVSSLFSVLIFWSVVGNKAEERHVKTGSIRECCCLVGLERAWEEAKHEYFREFVF